MKHTITKLMGFQATDTLPFKLLLLILSCIALSACSAHYGAAKIISHPAGAEVINMEDGTVLGVTPTESWWKYANDNNQHLALRFKKDGYHEKVTSFWLSMRHSSAEEAQKNPQLVEVSLQKRGD